MSILSYNNQLPVIAPGSTIFRLKQFSCSDWHAKNYSRNHCQNSNKHSRLSRTFDQEKGRGKLMKNSNHGEINMVLKFSVLHYREKKLVLAIASRLEKHTRSCTGRAQAAVRVFMTLPPFRAVAASSRLMSPLSSRTTGAAVSQVWSGPRAGGIEKRPKTISPAARHA